MRTHRNCRDKPRLELRRVKDLCRQLRVPCGNGGREVPREWRARKVWWETEGVDKVRA
jgi:hypothetical protein